ncbi:protein SprT [Philodulcilactobacillus myokoensis]|uniref:Protein SprT n=1 Tax=Philodulcilactobacillus myokoensis TaxID=2929573 RepID=A0A9W6B2F5_9LACO|nr:SprT family protein [Philodulcilactobacillus myokoensis]GLB47190.1 protein SprT [Philodulcilactobacillus myokoensis]
MSNLDLQQLVEKISLKYFQKPFKHRAYFNYRLKTTGGRYHLNDHNIDINPKMLNDFGYHILIGVIKHELCHYHLHLSGFNAKHSSPDFIHLLSVVGGSRYAPQPKINRRNLRYVCINCGQIYIRKRRINVRRYVCSRCHGHLKLINN